MASPRPVPFPGSFVVKNGSKITLRRRHLQFDVLAEERHPEEFLGRPVRPLQLLLFRDQRLQGRVRGVELPHRSGEFGRALPDLVLEAAPLQLEIVLEPELPDQPPVVDVLEQEHRGGAHENQDVGRDEEGFVGNGVVEKNRERVEGADDGCGRHAVAGPQRQEAAHEDEDENETREVDRPVAAEARDHRCEHGGDDRAGDDSEEALGTPEDLEAVQAEHAEQTEGRDDPD